MDGGIRDSEITTGSYPVHLSSPNLTVSPQVTSGDATHSRKVQKGDLNLLNSCSRCTVVFLLLGYACWCRHRKKKRCAEKVKKSRQTPPKWWHPPFFAEDSGEDG